MIFILLPNTSISLCFSIPLFTVVCINKILINLSVYSTALKTVYCNTLLLTKLDENIGYTHRRWPELQALK